MRNEPEFLSLPKLLRSAQEQGLELNERTLQYYVKRGLLPKGQKNPYSGADGRAVYWPVSVLKQVRRIFQLKQQGYKLEQIRLRLETAGKSSAPPIPPTETVSEDWRREVAYRYLKHSLGGQLRQLRQGLEALRPQDNAAWLEALRDYHVAGLSPLIGEEEAARWVDQFFLDLHPKELPRYLARFRAELGPPPVSAGSWVSDVGNATRQVVTQFRMGRVDPEAYLDYLRAQQKLFRRALLRLQKLEHPAAPPAQTAVQEVLARLGDLAQASQTQQDIKKILAHYGQCLERLRVATEVETQLDWLNQFS